MFDYISKHTVTIVQPDAPAVQAGKEISVIYLAPNLTLRSLIQLQRNLFIHLNTLCAKFPAHKFPRPPPGAGLFDLDMDAYHLNEIVENHKKQKNIITKAITQSVTDQLALILFRGPSLEKCVQYAERRKQEDYKPRNPFRPN